MKIVFAFLTLALSTSAFAQFTQKPVESKPAVSDTVYSCDDDSIILTVHGATMRGQYDLELKNATLGADKGISGKSEAGACVKVEKREMYVMAVPVCTVALPSGATHKLSFTGFEGQINTVNLVGHAGASASCHKL